MDPDDYTLFVGMPGGDISGLSAENYGDIIRTRLSPLEPGEYILRAIRRPSVYFPQEGGSAVLSVQTDKTIYEFQMENGSVKPAGEKIEIVPEQDLRGFKGGLLNLRVLLGGAPRHGAGMVCETYSCCNSPIHSIGPEARIVAAAAIGILVAVSSEPSAAAAGLASGIAFAAAAKLPFLPLIKRLAAFNAFMVVLTAVFALTGIESPSPAGPGYSHAEFLKAVHLALKANAVMLVTTALVSTINTVAMGHAMQKLKVPGKFTRLLFFTVRYVDLLHHEYVRLQRGVRVRCFRKRMSLRTYKTIGYVVGILFVRALARSERILAAMKCRGFKGVFHDFSPGKPATGDGFFILSCISVFLIIAGFEWIW